MSADAFGSKMNFPSTEQQTEQQTHLFEQMQARRPDAYGGLDKANGTLFFARLGIMASIHHYFARKQVGDTQKRGKPEMHSSGRNSLDLHYSVIARPSRG